ALAELAGLVVALGPAKALERADAIVPLLELRGERSEQHLAIGSLRVQASHPLTELVERRRVGIAAAATAWQLPRELREDRARFLQPLEGFPPLALGALEARGQLVELAAALAPAHVPHAPRRHELPPGTPP